MTLLPGKRENPGYLYPPTVHPPAWAPVVPCLSGIASVVTQF